MHAILSDTFPFLTGVSAADTSRTLLWTYSTYRQLPRHGPRSGAVNTHVRGELVAGRFRLLRAIGKGNMGEVYRAEDLQAGPGDPYRVVAVKLILRSRHGTSLDSIDDLRSVDRFAREVRIMRRLADHPNLPRTIDGGVDDSGLPYLAMELLDGELLKDLASENPQLPVPWVAALGAQIANGLAAAHAVDVVHRDLKPANVMLLRGGRVKVLDFGMGRIVDDTDQARVTSSSVTVGTARYMAPEQLGSAMAIRATDLYAFCCILFELFAGKPPFVEANVLDLASKQRNNPAAGHDGPQRRPDHRHSAVLHLPRVLNLA